MPKGSKKVKKPVAPAPTSTSAAGPAGAALTPPSTAPTSAAGTAVHTSAIPANQRYAIDTYAEQSKIRSGKRVGGKRIQGHHPIQDAWAKKNIAGYKSGGATSQFLETGKGQEHTKITNMQREARPKGGAWTKKSYSQARAEAVAQYEAADLLKSEKQGAKALVEADAKFFELGDKVNVDPATGKRTVTKNAKFPEQLKEAAKKPASKTAKKVANAGGNAAEAFATDAPKLDPKNPFYKTQAPSGQTVKLTAKDAVLDPKTGRVVAPQPKPAAAAAAPKPTAPVSATPKPAPVSAAAPKPTAAVPDLPKPAAAAAAAPKPTAPVSATPKPAPVSAAAPKPTAAVPDLPKPAAAIAAAPKPTTPVSATPKPAPVSAPAPKGSAAAPAVPQSAPQVHAPKASTVAHGVSTEAKTMAKVGKGARILAKLGKAGKFALKAIPIAGALFSTASAAEAAERGDYTSASLDMAGNIPVAGDLLDAGRGGVALGEAINEALDMEEETNMYGTMAQNAAKKIGFGDETSMYIGAAGAGLSAITVAPTTAIANKVKRWWRGD